MFKRWFFHIAFILLSPIIWADTPVNIRRVCENGTNNTLFYTRSNDPCAKQYKIWGRNGFVGAFSIVDSILVMVQDSYIHINASPFGATNWFYFVSVLDSCGPNLETFSDTVFVDRNPPEIINLDSVSVNPITNTTIAGWRGNRSSDFSYYKLYEIKNTNIPVLPFNKDTLRTDIGIIPVTDSVRYALSSVDSCGKETEFRFNRHVTMYLQENIDTCNKTVLLSWTPYIGWNRLKGYYIFKQYNIGEPFLYDSVSAGILSYTDSFTLGLSYAYFIRSVKDTTPFISSSSNSIRFTTRFRKEPKNSYLSLVTISKPNDDLFAVSLFNPEEEVNKYEILMSTSLQGFFEFKSEIINASSITKSYTTFIPFLPSIKNTKVVAYNSCNESFPVSPITEHVNLSVISADGKNILIWNPYLMWNVGVNKYLIYRGTNNPQGILVYSLFDSVTSDKYTFIDSLLPVNVGEQSVCYYVAAIQNGGDTNGQPLISNSTTACVLAPFLVYIPNAFRPEGVNSFFKPEGSSIDYEDSQMEIYDRWGSRIVSIKNIRTGWDGKDDSGKLYMQGVYFYKFNLISTNGTEKIFSGFVTLLN